MLRFAAATVSNTPIYSFWTRTLPSQQHHRLRWTSRRAGKRGRPTCRCQARRRTPNRPPPAPSHCRRTPGPRSDGCVGSSTVRRRCLPFDMPASSHLVLLQPLVEAHMARQHGGSPFHVEAAWLGPGWPCVCDGIVGNTLPLYRRLFNPVVVCKRRPVSSSWAVFVAGAPSGTA